MSVERWQVFRVLNCRHAKPHPKTKYVVVVGFEDVYPLGVFINSEIRNFIRSKPALLVCEVDIHQQTHSFLRHDSHIDCTNVYVFQAEELTDHLGTVADDLQKIVLKAVEECPTIVRKYKKLILTDDQS